MQTAKLINKNWKRLSCTLLSIALVLSSLTMSVLALTQTETKEYLTLAKPGETIRNDFPGYVGMKLTVGNKDLKVTELGRLFYGGTKGANDEDHEVRLVSADGMLLASVIVPAGGTDGKVTYAALADPVTLKASQSYYLVSLESATDYWYGSVGEGGATFHFENVATCDGAYYQTDEEGLNFALYDAAGPFVGTSFRYITESESSESEVDIEYRVNSDEQWLWNNPSQLYSCPDPYVYGGEDGYYYCYTTSGYYGFYNDTIPCWRSKDFRNWEFVGATIKGDSDHYYWAPEIIHYNGKYYMFYTEVNKSSWKEDIMVAESDALDHEFTNCRLLFEGNRYVLDPNVLVCKDGIYMYYADVRGIYERIGVVKLKDDLSGVDGEPMILLEPEYDWERNITEGPECIEYNGKYYLTYSGSGWEEYSMGYATSNSPTGPFVKNETPFATEKNASNVKAPGHHCLFRSPDGKELWCCYGAVVQHSNGDITRRLYFDRIGFDNEGKIYMSGPSIGAKMVPSGTNGYVDLALDATVSVTADFTAKTAQLVHDGNIDILGNKGEQWCSGTKTESPTIQFNLKERQSIEGLVLYNSGTKPLAIKKILFDGVSVMRDLTVPTAPNGMISLAFEPCHATTISVVIDNPSDDAVLSEVQIVSEGKHNDGAREWISFAAPGTLRGSQESGGLNGYVGAKITVGDRPIVVTDLGRIFVKGNTQAHEVLLVTTDGKTIASATVQGGTYGKYTYAKLNAPVTLNAGTSYYLVSKEFLDGDYWYHSDSFISFADGIHCDALCYSFDGVNWGVESAANAIYGMPNMIYHFVEMPVPNETKEYLTLAKPGETIRNDFPGYVGMKLTVGNKDLKVTELGRLFYGGTKGANDEDHEVRLVSADGKLVASVIVPAGGIDGKVTYAALADPITLKAGQSYYLVSLESATDYWYGSAGEDGATFSCENVATCDGAYYQTDEEGLSFALYDATGPFVGTSFKYEIDNSNDDDSDTPTPPEIDNSKNNSSDTSTSPKPMVKRDFFVKYQGTPTPRNNYEGYVGMKITVGDKPISVYSLGRIFITGNTQSHHVKLVDATTGKDIEGSTVTVKGGTDGKITYAKLERPIVLEAGRSYYIVSEEKDGGDFWYHNDAKILCQKDAKIDSAVFNYQGTWNLEGASSCAFGAVSMQYEVEVDNVPVLGDTASACTIAAALLLGLSALAFVSLRIAKKKF